MRPLLVLACCCVLVAACDPGSPDGTASSPEAFASSATPTADPEPSPSSTFGSSVEVGEADVRSDLEVRVAETVSEFDGRQVADGTLLTVPAEVLFDVDEATLRPEAAAALDRLVEVVEFYDTVPLAVTGHTDSDGSDEYNRDLSLRRASAVADYLVEAGVDAARLETAGRGEAEPVASNDTAEGKQQNRRVELLLIGAEAADR